MARIRSVHPGLFTDEGFVSCSPLARLLVIGLWTEADDAGAFEWKPVTIKMRLLPVDNADVPLLLDELAASNLIRRYSVGGRDLGLIRNFCRYQRPKKPKYTHVIPDELRSYVAIEVVGSEPVDADDGAGGEPDPSSSRSSSEPRRLEVDVIPKKSGMSPQMEEEGGRGGEEERTSLRSVGAPQPHLDDKSPAKSKSKTGTRIDPSWHPGPDDVEFGRSIGFTAAALDREAGRFRDYWIAKPGKDGVKLDWPATWRNWLRKAAEQAGIAPSAAVVSMAPRDERRKWEARLSWARRHRQWSRDWGPLPFSPGCRVPVDMLDDGDGQGWTEVDEAQLRKEG